MNPLVSLCSDRNCYTTSGGCRPYIVDTHLVRSHLFWIQMYVALTSALPLKAKGSAYADMMSKISHEQAGFRRAEQVDIAGIFSHLQKVYKEARPDEQNIMDNDLFIFVGNNQTKLRRDAIVSVKSTSHKFIYLFIYKIYYNLFIQKFIEGAFGEAKRQETVSEEFFTCVRDAHGCTNYQPQDRAAHNANMSFPSLRIRISRLTFSEILHLCVS